MEFGGDIKEMGFSRLLAGMMLAVIVPGAAPAAAELFPSGERLRPRVEFWTLIYSRITTDQVLLHDAENLGIVYQLINLEGRQEWRDIERFVQPIRERYAETLRALAAGTPAGPGSEAATILARFGPGVSAERLRRAADNVRFQRGQADAFLEGLVRRGAYEDHMKRIFRAEGVPLDLTYLPHVESSFRPHAYSRSGAAGIWQFTRSTGRHYLRISNLVDERWDPIEATRAAARLLRYNHQQLGSWPVAITAYNHGLAGMRRAVERTGTKDLEEIIDRYEGRIFGFASKNFYAEFLAAREVASQPEKYFGAAPRWPLLQYQELRVDRAVLVPELLRALQLSICDLTHYNPALRPPALAGEKPLPLGYRLKLPAGSQPPGVSLASLVEEFMRPALRAAAGAPAAQGDAPAGPRAGAAGRPKAGPEPLPAWIASLTIPPGPGPVSRTASYLFDSALLWAHPGGRGPAPRLASAPAPPGAAAVARPPDGPMRDAPPASGAAPPGNRPASAAAASPWAWLGASLPSPLRLHPDWQPWMRSEPHGMPASVGLSALRITDGRIQVEPEENLALIASWLNVSASRLRQLNELRAGQSLRLGQWLHADFSRVGEEEFFAQRLRYQRGLADGFLRANRVTATRLHEVRPGETLSSIARRNGRLPLWLLRWYNDGPSWLEPAPGARIVVPVVERLAS